MRGSCAISARLGAAARPAKGERALGQWQRHEGRVEPALLEVAHQREILDRFRQVHAHERELLSEAA